MQPPGREVGRSRLEAGLRRASRLGDSNAPQESGGVANMTGGGAREGLDDWAIRLCYGQPVTRPGRWRPPGGLAVTLGCCAISWASAGAEDWGW